MIDFKIDNKLPNPYCIVYLSNNTAVYENNTYVFWRKLRHYCIENNVTINKMVILFNNSDKNIFVKRNNIKYYFIIRQAKSHLRSKITDIRKGYGVVCIHPGAIKKTYISWYDDVTGKFIYNEVFRGVDPIYEKEIGIPQT